ncbi:hypothetical protein I5589_10440 [Burkholderia vietnamiensis]|uniref:Uncharacterized protein n=1 Tax=Burkholderia vietnamiensis TaxID=60552 RepID=A0ABS1ATM6_BURVI|nr:hypothetical protein [Burkholderia vietnamiensis]
MHSELQSIELPEWLAFEDWDMWCEHREAKHKDAPWTRPAATVSIRKLTKLREQGQDPKACIEEAVLRGWTGLFELKGVAAARGVGASVAASLDWHKTTAGVTERGKQLGVTQKDGEVFMRFKARVVKAAGPGEWMEEMLRDAARFGDEQYEALYAYFNDIPRDQIAQREAA